MTKLERILQGLLKAGEIDNAEFVAILGCHNVIREGRINSDIKTLAAFEQFVEHYGSFANDGLESLSDFVE